MVFGKTMMRLAVLLPLLVYVGAQGLAKRAAESEHGPPVEISRSIFTHWELRGGTDPHRDPQFPQIRPQRVCI